ncbi:hypothetical protein BU16DRAFT_132584 [Lophium mytilinum]|uniref:Uncharacterized protein n=1 Tax=Lophium mytilinum TaxID=390894 RepID=A0A6A6QGF1_9PEZI|nr:hypothetical protein BU16DRAFT_132584 [Lophium mytilinum]
MTTGLNGLCTPLSTYGHTNAQLTCVECGTFFPASPLQTRCNQCIAASQTSVNALESGASPPTPRSSSDEEPVFYWQQSANRRASDPATMHDRRSSSVRSFWSPRVGTPSDGRTVTDTGNPQRTSRSRQKRVGKAKREAESRSKQGEKLKILEDLILASEFSSRLTDTPELNSNNAQKSGLTYRKEVVLDVTIQALGSQNEKIRSSMRQATMLRDFVGKAKCRFSPESWAEAGLLEGLNDICGVYSKENDWYEPATLFVQASRAVNGLSSKL